MDEFEHVFKRVCIPFSFYVLYFRNVLSPHTVVEIVGLIAEVFFFKIFSYLCDSYLINSVFMLTIRTFLLAL